ncbi:polyprotein [Phanerochaete sordida]|uniref:Polyprotein n=1 Tax=Phanerochaete sordida TaxID=48140 RepID=A0A9P3GIQ4_9APHY|nr:polyprotein [Phanerochaete sordida]
MEGRAEGSGFSGGSSRFELLHDSNWYAWKYRMEMHLFRKELWGLVSGEEPRPVANARAQAAWDKRAKLAAAEIALHVSDGQLPLIRKTTDPKEMWRILKETHENAGWANRMALMRRFLLLRKEPDVSMQDHLNRFQDYYQALIDVKVDISDILKVTVLLASLPEEYENIVTAIESYIEDTGATDDADESGEKKPSPNYDYVMRRLLNEEKRRNLVQESRPEAAYAAKAKRRQRREDITCFECKEKGHYRNECPKAKKEHADVGVDFGFWCQESGDVMERFDDGIVETFQWTRDGFAL